MSPPFQISAFFILTRKIFSLCLKGIKLRAIFSLQVADTTVEICNCQIILCIYWWYKYCGVPHIENEKKIQDNLTSSCKTLLTWHLVFLLEIWLTIGNSLTRWLQAKVTLVTSFFLFTVRLATLHKKGFKLPAYSWSELEEQSASH